MYKRGDMLWSPSRCVVGEIRGVDSVNEPHYYVRWDNDPFAMWEYSNEVEPLREVEAGDSPTDLEQPEDTTPFSLTDMVNHPPHYNTGKIEVIDFIEDQGLEHHEASTVKYIARAGKKDPDTRIQDLEKGVWYLQRKIALLKGETND